MNQTDVREHLFAAIRYLADLIPEMRSGQLVAVLGKSCADIYGQGLWEASDTELLMAVWRFRRDYEMAMLKTDQGES